MESDSSSSDSTSGARNHTTTRPPLRQKRPRHTRSKWQATWAKYRLKSSKKGTTYAYCTVCSSDFSVSGGGVHDVKRHCKSVKHTKLLKDIEAQPSISSSLTTSTPTLNEQVRTAELYFTS